MELGLDRQDKERLSETTLNACVFFQCKFGRGFTVMIVAVQFLYCFLKEVVEALLVGYSDEGKHEIAREDATCFRSDAADGECHKTCMTVWC